jgi:putative aldouronate transport system permease protein
MTEQKTIKSGSSGLKYLSIGDKIFDFVNVSLLVILLIITLYPLIFVLSASVSDPIEVVTGRVFLLPRGFNLDAYKRVFTNDTIAAGYRNSTFYTVLGVSISMVLTIFAAFGLSRPDLKGRKLLTILITLTIRPKIHPKT